MPCQFWSVGPRVHGGKESCGKPATRGALAPPWADIKRIPICEECIVNLGYEFKNLRNL
jgi:hypothetical protein